MKYKESWIFVLLILTLSLVLTACGGGEPAPAAGEGSPVEDQPVAEDASAEATELEDDDSVQVTNLEQIVGTWIAPAYPGNFVITILPDGVLKVATSLEDIERGSTDSWNLSIEDGQITATDYALCLGDIGTYVAEIDREGNLRFISVIDACDARLRKMDRSLPGRLHEYILLYRPVN